MKKLKRALSLIAAVSVLTTGLLTGCSKEEKPSKTAEQQSTSGKEQLKPVNLKWYVFGVKQPDHDVVMTELNKKLDEKLKVTLDLQVLDAATFEERMKAIVATGEKYDICFTSNWKNKFWENVAKGAFKDLDELIAKNAPGLKNVVSDSVMDVTKVNGKTYAVPNLQVMYSSFGFAIQKELADKYKFDAKTIKNYRDIEPFLEIIKKNEPNLYPCRVNHPGPGSLNYELFGGSNLFAVKRGDKSLKVVAWCGTKEEKEDFDLLREWHSKGYIRQDQMTVMDDSADEKANKYAVKPIATKPGVEGELLTKWGKEFVVAPFEKPYLQATAGSSTMNAISVQSKNPDRAIKLIELVNTDKEIYNMILFGIENTHYKKISNDTVEVPKDTRYQMGSSGWMYGNQFNAFYMKGQQPGIWEETDKLNKSADVSVLRGFNLDQTPIQAEIAKLTAVQKEFQNMQFTPDFEKRYTQYMEKMKTAGLEKALAEVQNQVDAWAKANGKK